MFMEEYLEMISIFDELEIILYKNIFNEEQLKRYEYDIRTKWLYCWKDLSKARINDLVMALDAKVNEEFSEYLKIHDKFNEYRGKMLDEETLKEVNIILEELQKKYNELYIFFYFVTQRNDYSKNNINSFDEFISTLKTAGAVQVASTNEQSIIIDPSSGN